MPDQRNIFLPGEWAMIADEDRMRTKLAKYRNRDEVIEALRPFIGERIRIVGYSFPHGSGVLYELQGIEQHVWGECLIDWSVAPGDPSYGAASEFYDIQIERDGEEDFVTVRDKAGRLFSKTWHAEPRFMIEEMSEIASARTRPAFEHRYGFSGDHMGTRPTANTY